MRAARLGDLRDLPCVVPAEQAFSVLGVSRTAGYAAVRAGTFPVSPLPGYGRLLRFSTIQLLGTLGIAPELAAAVLAGDGDRGPEGFFRDGSPLTADTHSASPRRAPTRRVQSPA